MATLEQHELACELLSSRQFNWCRARLLHALAGAAAQGVLDEVIHELLDDAPDVDAENVIERILAYLVDASWMNRDARLIDDDDPKTWPKVCPRCSATLPRDGSCCDHPSCDWVA
jgi:hypothetical protein